MPYDVGQIARQLQTQFRLFAPSTNTLIDERDQAIALELADDSGGTKNLATPENLAVLLAALRDFTAALLVQRAAAGTDGDVSAQWDKKMVEWRGRLGAYDDAVAKAPPGDRADVVWSVTAPLLLGFFGGAASQLPRQPLDAITPFQLANMLEVSEAWREERWDLLWSDIAANVKDAVSIGAGIGTLALGAVVVIGGLLIFSKVRR